MSGSYPVFSEITASIQALPRFSLLDKWAPRAIISENTVWRNTKCREIPPSSSHGIIRPLSTPKFSPVEAISHFRTWIQTIWSFLWQIICQKKSRKQLDKKRRPKFATKISTQRNGRFSHSFTLSRSTYPAAHIMSCEIWDPFHARS